ncbi:MAG: hypothetical protein FD180_2941 [Planctomycetota bacterium]|nr:MAG: hypothetical protein FD180_2941 [Planctomycetota bacterium]
MVHMKKLLVLAAFSASAIVFATGCHRKPEPDPDIISGAPRPLWTASEVTTVEGKLLPLTLTLVQAATFDVEVSLSTGGVDEISFPEIVTFTAGTTSRVVSVTAIANELGPTRDPVLTATTGNGSSAVTIHILDDDADLGLAVGPVTFGSGVVVLAGPGTDTIFGTPDDELIAAKDIGAGTPVLSRGVVGSLSGGPECAPVVAVGGSAVLLLAIGAGPTVVQVQSVPDAPAVTSSVVLSAPVGSVSRPVMIGTRAVLTSRGSDFVTSPDDRLFVVEGIGTATLTVKTVFVPGLAPGEPSIPVQLSSTSLLITTAGFDSLFGTGDEVLTLVAGLDTASPTVTSVFSGRINGDASGRALASAGTIAAVATAGADAIFASADDTLQVVRDVFGVPTPAPPLVVGPLASGDAGLCLSTGGDAAVVPTRGVDLLQGTLDDQVVAVFPLSIDPMVATLLSAPRGLAGLQGALVPVSISSAARLDPGADGILGSSDDGVRLFTLLNTVTPAAASGVTGGLQGFAPLIVDTTSLALCGLGLDGIVGTDDDVTIRVTGIGGSTSIVSGPSGAFAPLATPALVPGVSGQSVVARTSGPDAAPGTVDDRLSVAAAP